MGTCSVTGRPIEPGTPYVAALRETPEGFERREYLLEAWDEVPTEAREGCVAFWRTTMPRPNEKKRLLVDDEVLAELFRRLADVAEPDKLAFRFVLGLILMRKKLLSYEGQRADGDREVWLVRFRKSEETLELVDPKLDESRLEEVGKQVGQILNGGIEQDALA